MNITWLTDARREALTQMAAHTASHVGQNAFTGRLPANRTNVWTFAIDGGEAEDTQAGFFTKLHLFGTIRGRFVELEDAETFIMLLYDLLETTQNLSNNGVFHYLRLTGHAEISEERILIEGDTEDTDHWAVQIPLDMRVKTVQESSGIPSGPPPPPPPGPGQGQRTHIAMIDGSQHDDKPGDGLTLLGMNKRKFAGQHEISKSTRRWAYMSEVDPTEGVTGRVRFETRTAEKFGDGDPAIPLILNQEASDPDVPQSKSIWILDATEGADSGRTQDSYEILMAEYEAHWQEIWSWAKAVVNCPVGIYGLGPTSYKRGTLMNYIVRENLLPGARANAIAAYETWIAAETLNFEIYKTQDLIVPNLYLFTPGSNFNTQWGMTYIEMMKAVLTEKINVYKRVMGSDMKPVCVFFWWEFWDPEKLGDPEYRAAVPPEIISALCSHALSIDEIEWIYWWTNGYNDGSDPSFAKVELAYEAMLPFASAPTS